MPWEVTEIVRSVRERFPNSQLGIHTHNDGECAVANTLAAVREGASRCRARSTAMASAAATPTCARSSRICELKLGCSRLPDGSLHEPDRAVALSSPRWPTWPPTSTWPTWARPPSRTRAASTSPPCGASALSYQHIDPAAGRQRDAGGGVSELSGRGNLLSKAEEYGLEIDQATDVSGRAERDQGAGIAGLFLRGRRGLRDADAQAPAAGLQTAL